MTTVYSTAKTHDGISYRAKVDYTITTNPTTVVVNATVQMQYKGTYSADSILANRGKLRTKAHNNGNDYITVWDSWKEEYQYVSGSYININATNFPSKSAWTNKGSALSATITYNRLRESRSVTAYAGIGGAVQTSGDTFGPSDSNAEISVSVPALDSWDVVYKSNNGTTDTFWQKKKYRDRDMSVGYVENYVGPTDPTIEALPTREGYHRRYNNGNILNTSPDETGTYYKANFTGLYSGGTSDTYTQNQALTLYMTWSFYVNYDGNGASISAYTYKKQEIDEHGSITLNSNIPTRTGYVFKEWNTAADGTGTSYDPGDTYSQNTGDITLYAIWLSLPQNPQIGNMTAIRSNAQGQQDDTGTYASISADWSIDTTSEAYPQNTGTVTGTITPQSTGVEQSFTISSGGSGTSGTATALISGLSTDEQYIVKITVTDQHSNTSKSVILTRAFFIMDFKAGGKGIGIGRAAPDEGLEIGYEAEFDDNVTMLEDLDVRGILHAHLSDQATIANGDKLLFSDSSDNGKIVRASVTFDGSTQSKALTQKGTFETFPQTAFDKVKVGSDTIEADSVQDTLEIVQGPNVILTPDTTNDKLTIGASDQIFIAEYGVTTYAEITAAISDGKVIVAKKSDGTCYFFDGLSDGYYWFSRFRMNRVIPTPMFISVGANGTWNTGGTYTLSLGSFTTVGGITSNASTLWFSIPTGRLFPTETTLGKITFNLLVRAGSSNGTGIYIVKSTSGGSSSQAFDSSTTTKFYNGGNTQKSLTSAMWTVKSLYGSTNLNITLNGGSDHFFSGSSTNSGYINNHACICTISSITVSVTIP